MNERTPQECLSAYRQWRRHVTRAIKDLDGWLTENMQATDETRAAIDAAQAAMHSDHMTVGFIPGGGRGTSELINALFFHEYGRGLLPSYTGYASTCPTELCWDASRTDAYLRLLPVETRAQDIPFDQLRADPKIWVDYPLNVQDAEKMVTRLSEIAQTKVVSRAEAARLRLGSAEPTPGALAADEPVEIPKWRYAILSIPSSLLRLGLVVLDVPVLDSRWRELDLATDLLAGAHTIVSVLAIGEEDWASDLQLLHRLCGTDKERLIVALNKIDRLWSAAGATQVELATAEGRAAAAAALGLDPSQVFPVSAQRALAARLLGDKTLLRTTGVEALEAHLLTRLLNARREAQVAALDQALGCVFSENRARITARIGRAKAQLAELEEYCEKSAGVIGPLLGKTRQEQEIYLRSVQRFQACRDDLIRETQHCREILDRDTIEDLVAKTHTGMVRSWTTIGMAGAMKGLFDELRRAMQVIGIETERVRKLVRATYDGFQRDFGFELAAPKVFVPMKFRVEMELLYQEVDAFCRSPGLALAEQGTVIRRFHEELVSRARVLFDQLLDAFDTWIRDALQPLAEQIDVHKGIMERRLDNLQRLGRSKDDVQHRIADTHADYVELARQLTALRNIHSALREERAGEQHRHQRPQPVAKQA